MPPPGPRRPCLLDGKSSLAYTRAGSLLLYTRANLRLNGGARFVQVTSSASGQPEGPWGPYRLLNISGLSAAQIQRTNIYLAAVNPNPADGGRTLIGLFPVLEEDTKRATISSAVSCDGVHFSPLKTLIASQGTHSGRTLDHPVDGFVRRGNRVHMYVHLNVPGIATDLEKPPPPQLVRLTASVSVMKAYGAREAQGLPGCEDAFRGFYFGEEKGRDANGAKARHRRANEIRRPTAAVVTPAPQSERSLALMQQQHVQREQWEAYVLTLYRATRDDLPRLPQMGEVDMIYDTKLDLSCVAVGAIQRYKCEQHPLIPFKARAPHSPRTAWFVKEAPFTAIPDSTWTEVSHCSGSTYETKAAFFYVAKGSALYVNTGKTIAFNRHSDAVEFFLGRPCAVQDKVGQCDKELPQLLPDAAVAKGYDSIQFIRHCDLCALPNLQCGHELMLLKTTDGGMACPKNVEFRTGVGGRDPCRCVPSTLVKSDRGSCAVCQGSGLEGESWRV